MEYITSIIDSIAWPATVLIIFFVLRERLVSMLPLVKNVKYKDLEVTFREGLADVRAETEEAGIEVNALPEEKEEIFRLVERSTSVAIIESWREIELSAAKKIEALVKDEESLLKARERPLDYLEHKGALIPSTARAIRDLRSLRNQVVHIKDTKLNNEDVIEYVTLANAITKQINGITELPKQKLVLLTYLIFQFTHLIDTDKYNDISIEDIHTQIKNKSVIAFLKEETAEDSDFSIFDVNGAFSDYLDYYYEQLLRLYECYAGEERRKWGVKNSGLCLLVAWTNEIIQQGSGWHPE